MAIERKLFAVRVHAVSLQFLQALMWGWIGGLVISLGVVGTGMSCLMCLPSYGYGRLRLFCYCSAFDLLVWPMLPESLGILHVVVDAIPGLSDIEQLDG